MTPQAAIRVLLLLTPWLQTAAHPDDAPTVPVRGAVLDAATGRPLPCRIAIQRQDGAWFFPKSSAPEGSAVAYRKTRSFGVPIVEMHTTLSAHPFTLDLPPGDYTFEVEHGKEYLPERLPVAIGREPVALTIRLRRWADLAARGWYSGETHVHRSLDELPNLLLAEDLNVAFPMLDWTRAAFVSPRASRPAEVREPAEDLIVVDSTHVIYARNTEYELFTVGAARHTLGAFFVIGHKTALELPAPPVAPVARRAHHEGALIELDKHNWPWSLVLVPVMKVDLFELANNHLWRTTFGFTTFGDPAPAYMQLETTAQGLTERGWIDYGFQAYYALLNCGFRLRPTAGTASGVHPVPLGFSRVYVHLPGGFNADAWFEGLNAGRSFVTTGPMLFATLNDHNPGSRFDRPGTYRLSGSALAPNPLQALEVVVNGTVAHTLPASNQRTPHGAYESPLDLELPIDTSTWIAVRCFENRPDRRPRFAHTAPFFVDIPDRPVRPRREEVAWLIERVEAEIARSRPVLPDAALAEYREALRTYRRIAETAR